MAVLAASEAAAQTTVPDGWALKPAGLGTGDRFRLLFVTSTTRDATSSDIADYDSHVQSAAAGGHTDIRSYSAQFRAVGSTATVDARDHTMTTGTGVPIYWLGGNKVADDYADFYDGSWDEFVDLRDETGGSASITSFWTGSNDDGTKHIRPLGSNAPAYGQFDVFQNLNAPSTSYGLLALSPVFEVGLPPGASLSVSDGTVAESAEPTLMRFTVTLSEPVARLVRVRIETRASDPVSAGMHHDFRPLRRDLTFRAGETEAHVWVTVHRDGRAEGAEMFEVVLSRADGAALGDAVGVGTITDGPMPTVSVSRSSLSLDEGGAAARYSVAVSAAPAQGETVTVTATSPDPGAVRVNGAASAALRFTASDWMLPQTVTVTPRDDADMDDESVQIAHAVSGPSGWSGVTAPAVTVSVKDDEGPAGPPAVGFAQAASSAAEDAGTHEVTVRLSPAPTSAITLSYTVGGTATAGTDFSIANSGTVTVASGATRVTIPVAVIDDALNEPDETVVLTLAEGTGYELEGAGTHTLTIADDDEAPSGAPSVTVSAGDAATEGGGAAFTLHADRTLASDLAVTVAVSDAAAGDFVAAGGEGERIVTIPSGQTSVDFTVPTVPDSDDEPSGRVTAAVLDGEGYAVGAAASASVAVADDDPTAVTLAGPTGSIAEADGSGTLTVTLGRALVEGERLDVPVVLGGAARSRKDYGVRCWTDVGIGCYAVGDPGGYVYFVGGPGAATAARVQLWTLDDGEDEGTDETVTVSLGAFGGNLGGGATGSGAVSFTITDDDDPLPVVTIAGGSAITEGGNAVFTVSAAPAPSADLAVWAEVSETPGGDFVAHGVEGRHMVTISSGQGSATLTVPTVADDTDEPDGTVRAALAGGTGYRVGAASSAEVAVADDDVSAAPTVSIDDATAAEGNPTRRIRFTVRLSAPQPHWVRVWAQTRDSAPVSARAWQDYVPSRPQWYFRPGQTELHLWVLLLDDSHNEDPETFELVLYRASGAAIGDGVAVGTITNDDPMPAAFLARFGRTVAEQALDGIAGRMAAPRTPGMQGSLAGQALSFDPAASGQPAAGQPAMPGVAGASGTTAANREAVLAMADIARGPGSGVSTPAGPGSMSGAGPGGAADPFGNRFGTPSLQSRTMTARDALLGSSFSLTGARDGAGGSMAFWGRAAQGSFDGREGTFSLGGEATTAMLGADYARGNWLVGLALAQSAGEGDYRDTGIADRPDSQTCPGDAEHCREAVRAGDGSVEASLTAAIPYAALQVSERLKLWGAAGHGTGEVTLETALGGRYSADTSWSMAAAGLRGDLLAPPVEGSGPALAVTSDALWTRTSSEKTRDLAASDSDATRLRIGLEGSYRVALEDGGELVPKVEVGARHDGGDAETGSGLEIGGGLKWVDPGIGLTLDVSGRTLIAHENDDLKDRGFAASLAYDPDPATKRGLSLGLRQEYGGQAEGGLDALFRPATLEERAGSEAASRWSLEAAYGFPAFGGRFTASPHAGFGLATAARDYSLGWRVTPEAATAPDLSFGLRATRRESDAAAPEHTVGFELTARW